VKGNRYEKNREEGKRSTGKTAKEKEEADKRAEEKEEKKASVKREVTEVTKRILLFDENFDLQLLTGLREEGYEVVACESLYRAWGVHFLYRPDCIIVHLQRPNNRDVTILQECRALAKGIPVIAVISTPGDEAIMKAVQETATFLMFLPAKPQTIRKILQRLATSEGEKRPHSVGGKAVG
jgi:DNA-binding NtrC family response regulator